MELIKKEIKKLVGFTYIIFMLLYFFRNNLYKINNHLLTFFLGITPNLFPSFLFTIILYTNFASKKINKNKLLFIINLSNLFLFLLIEYLHLLFNLGYWDNYDILASIIGIIFASFFVKYNKNNN